MKLQTIKALLSVLFLLVAFYSYGQTADKPLMVEEDPPLSVTNHSVKLLNGQTLNYQATCGYLILRNEQGESKAKVFFTAYTGQPTGSSSKRPITYTFNGGPGSSSVWLHMGGLGPKRILMTDKGEPTAPPYQVVDNAYTWLGMTDLVFIDPVETGFSRPAKNVDKKEFTGFENDIESVGAFIHAYTNHFHRWSSPKYLAGESYGTTRAAGLSKHLQQRYGMYLNGLVLISAITNFQTARFDRGNDLPYILFLPTYAAMARYHGKLNPQPSDLKDFLAEVEEFALGDYTSALMKGDALPAAEFDAVVDKLSNYTGLDKTYIKQTNLRINIRRFIKELRRDEGLTVGRLDGRMTGLDYDDAGEGVEFDPSYDATILGPYSSAINDHLRNTLKYNSDLTYEILTSRVRPWSYSNVENTYLNVSETLRGAMHRNTNLKVLICNGYYDLATPYFATDYTIKHMFLDPSVRKNIIFTYYEAGHMMYIHKPSLEKLTQDVNRFYGDR